MADGRGLQKGNAALSIEQDINLEALRKGLLLERESQLRSARAVDPTSGDYFSPYLKPSTSNSLIQHCSTIFPSMIT